MAEKKKANALSNNQKKDFAKALYLQGDLTQKEIALRVGTSENSLSNWARDGKWSALRTSLLTRKSNIINNLYAALEKLNEKLNTEDGVGDVKLADAFSKLTASIKNLETEAGISEIAEVARIFVKWLIDLDPALALLVTNHFDEFIKQRLKRS